jgi:hypothetical protein
VALIDHLDKDLLSVHALQRKHEGLERDLAASETRSTSWTTRPTS